VGLHVLTARARPFAEEEVPCRAVTVVPHEGVGKSLVAGRQVVHAADFHAVLVTVAVVIRLAVIVAVLGPAGEPVCKRHTQSQHRTRPFVKDWVNNATVVQWSATWSRHTLGVHQWLSAFIVRVPPDLISLRLCNPPPPEVVGY
jgi:hypothetical protein